MKRIKRTTSILLGIAMLLVLLSTAALAAAPADTADFTTNPTAALALLNAAKTEGAEDSTWNGSTLTLKGVNFTTSATTAVKLPDGAKIVLTDGTTNTITGGNATVGSSCNGIYAEGTLTIQGGTAGTGTLTVNGGAALYFSCGIRASTDVTISGGKVNANGGDATGTGSKSESYGIYASRNVTISGGTIEAKGGAATGTEGLSCGIYAFNGSVTITGGTANVTAEGGTATGAASDRYDSYNYSYGIYAGTKAEISGGAQVTATGGTATGTASNRKNSYSYSYGIYAGTNVESTGGTVTATGGKATGTASDSNNSYSYSYGIYAGTNVEISGGTEVTAEGGEAKMSGGIYASNNVIISDGTVTAKGGTADWYSEGIHAKSVEITGGTVNANGGEADYESYGIYAYGTATISGGTVEAKGGTANGISFGIYADNVNISGSTTKVTATGGEADTGSIGIYTSEGVTISGGTVTAKSGPADSVSCGIWAGYEDGEGQTHPGTVIINAGTGTVTVILDTGAAGNKVLEGTLTLGTDIARTGADDDLKQKYADTPVVFSNVTRADVTVSGITVNNKTYDGTTAATLNVGSVTLTGVASGDIVSLDTDNVTATFDNKNVGTGKPVTVTGTFDLRGKDAYKYYLTLPGLGNLTANITACTTVTDTTETAQTIYVGEGSSFRTPTFTGVGGETATGTVTYTVGGESKTLDEIIAHLNTLTAGDSVSVNYSFTGTDNYAGATASGTITVTVTSRPAPVIPIVTTYPVTAAQPENGAVTVSPANAAAGVTVTVTVTPDKGYELASLTVTDAGGKGITLTDKGDGKYTFTMPAGKVTVNAAFSRVTLPFVDVPADAYYYDAVAWAVENKITDGTSDITFSPNAPCTRGQIVTFLWRAAGCPEPKSSVNPFTDVEEGAYYSKAVLWAVENGITDGTGDGTTFSPADDCDCGQIVTFLYRWLVK